MPWVTAFSTSGWSSRGGTAQARAASSRRVSKVRREPNRTFSMARRLLGERQLLAERDAVARAHGEAAPQEVGEHDAGAARRLGLAPDERDDRVQAVEEEVGVELGAQRLQLGLARRDLELEALGLRPARALEGDEQVVHERGDQEEEEAAAEEEGLEAREGRSRALARARGAEEPEPAPRHEDQSAAEVKAAPSWVPRTRAIPEGWRGAARHS